MSFKRFLLKRDDLVGIVLIGTIFAACLAENLVAVSALMDTTVGTAIQYAIAIVAVVVEALGLIKMREAFRYRKFAAAAGLLLITGLATTQSVLNELAFYRVNYANKSQGLVREKAISDDLGKEKAEIEARLAANAGIRPASAIEADIAVALNRTVRVSRRKEDTLRNLTHECMNTRADWFDRCGDVLTLRSELANAVAMLPQIAKDRARLEAIRASGNWVTSIGVTHPGADQLASWYNDVGAKYHWQKMSEESAQALYILVGMILVQVLNLILPCCWFCAEDKKAGDAVDQSIAIGSMHHSASIPHRAQDEESKTDLHPTETVQRAVGDAKAPAGKASASVERPQAQKQDAPMPPSQARLDEGRPATHAVFPKQHEAIVRRHQGPGNAFSLDSHDPAKVESVRTFIKLYCTYDAGVDEVSSDIHAAYQRATDRKLAYAHRQFTAVLRQVARQPIEILQIHRKHHLRGIRLNDAGRRLLIKTGSHRRAAIGEAKLVVAI